jgi:hypothetical protein
MRAIALLILLAIGGCLGGCMGKSRNHREIGFRWGTEVILIDRTAKTSGGEPGDVYESSFESPPLVEWLLPRPTPAVLPP